MPRKSYLELFITQTVEKNKEEWEFTSKTDGNDPFSDYFLSNNVFYDGNNEKNRKFRGFIDPKWATKPPNFIKKKLNPNEIFKRSRKKKDISDEF